MKLKILKTFISTVMVVFMLGVISTVDTVVNSATDKTEAIISVQQADDTTESAIMAETAVRSKSNIKKGLVLFKIASTISVLILYLAYMYSAWKVVKTESQK